MLLKHCFRESEALSVVELQESADRSFATEQTKGFVQGLWPWRSLGTPCVGDFLVTVSQHKQGKSQALVKVYIFAVSLEVDVRESKEAVKRL